MLIKRSDIDKIILPSINPRPILNYPNIRDTHYVVYRFVGNFNPNLNPLVMKSPINKFYVALLILFVIAIIFIAPWALTLDVTWLDVDYRGFGAIGDTIGGLTAPFLNGLSAVLVFYAFKAQIEANKIFQNLEQNKLNRDDFDNLKSRVDGSREYLLSLRNELRGANSVIVESTQASNLRELILFFHDFNDLFEVAAMEKKYSKGLALRMYRLSEIYLKNIALEIEKEIGRIGETKRARLKRLTELLVTIQSFRLNLERWEKQRQLYYSGVNA